MRALGPTTGQTTHALLGAQMGRGGKIPRLKNSLPQQVLTNGSLSQQQTPTRLTNSPNALLPLKTCQRLEIKIDKLHWQDKLYLGFELHFQFAERKMEYRFRITTVSRLLWHMKSFPWINWNQDPHSKSGLGSESMRLKIPVPKLKN